MRNVSALGILVSLIALGCAPVASSGPKSARVSPSMGDKFVTPESGRYELRNISARVISVEESEDFEKSLATTDLHVEDKFDAKSTRRNEIRDDRGATRLGMSTQISRADVQVVFVLNVPAKSLSKDTQEQLKQQLTLEGYRNDRGSFSFSVSRNEASDKAWAFVKSNLSSVWILDREAMTKN